MSSTLRLTAIVIGANLAVNALGLVGYNAMRQHAMAAAAEDRRVIQQKLDAAWYQRERLTAATIKACGR